MRWSVLVLAGLAYGAFCSALPAVARPHLNLARAASPAPHVVTTARPGTDAYELAQMGGVDPVTDAMLVFASPAPALPTPSPLLASLSSPGLSAPTPADTPLSVADFLAQVLSAIQALGGLSLLLKVSVVITLLVSSMKVSALNDLVWKPLGAAQPWVAPFLGFLAGVAGLGAGGVPVTAASVFAYVSAGGGAVFLHEIFDSLKSMPVVGVLHMRAIEALKKTLGGAKSGEPKTIIPREP